MRASISYVSRFYKILQCELKAVDERSGSPEKSVVERAKRSEISPFRELPQSDFHESSTAKCLMAVDIAVHDGIAQFFRFLR